MNRPYMVPFGFAQGKLGSPRTEIDAAMNKKRMVREMERIVGKGMVIHHPDDLLVYEYDGSVAQRLMSTDSANP